MELISIKRQPQNEVKMKNLALFLLGFYFTSLAGPISPILIGNNAWMSQDTYYGQIENLWGWMDDADYQLIRIGGHGALSQAKNLAWVYRTVDSVRAFGGEILLQVPSDFSGAEAAEYIRQINVVAGKNIQYWAIGNEPDWQLAGGGNDPQGVDLSVTGVANYTRTIAQGLRTVDPDIFIFGGGFAWYNTQYLGELLGTGANGITGKDANGHYYIDGIMWNHYDANSPNRSVEQEVQDILTRFEVVNARRPDKPMEWSIGEYNSNVGNDNVSIDMKAWSFQTGQNFAITYGVGMRYGAITICPWSMHESSGARTNYDLGLFDGNNGNYAGRSSYWHSSMLGQNMKTQYPEHSDNQDNIVVIPMHDASGIAVMVLNTSKTQAYNVALRLDDGAFASSNPVQIRVSTATNQEIEFEMQAYSTQMLVFDAAGNYIKNYEYTSIHADNRVGPTVTYPNVAIPQCEVHAIGDRIEAENYCSQFGIQTEPTTDVDLGLNIGYTTAGDYLTYLIDVQTSGDYEVLFRLAVGDALASFDLYINDQYAGNIESEDTGGWQFWETHSLTTSLETGENEIRIEFIDGGMNINWLELIGPQDAPVGLNLKQPMVIGNPLSARLVNAKGQMIGRSSLEHHGNFNLNKPLMPGAYRVNDPSGMH
jgi:hypothetical protein